MRTFKNNKELQANTHCFIEADAKEKNARGKKTSWVKAVLKKATRHLRRQASRVAQHYRSALLLDGFY